MNFRVLQGWLQWGFPCEMTERPGFDGWFASLLGQAGRPWHVSTISSLFQGSGCGPLTCIPDRTQQLHCFTLSPFAPDPVPRNRQRRVSAFCLAPPQKSRTAGNMGLCSRSTCCDLNNTTLVRRSGQPQHDGEFGKSGTISPRPFRNTALDRGCRPARQVTLRTLGNEHRDFLTNKHGLAMPSLVANGCIWLVCLADPTVWPRANSGVGRRSQRQTHKQRCQRHALADHSPMGNGHPPGHARPPGWVWMWVRGSYFLLMILMPAVRDSPHKTLTASLAGLKLLSRYFIPLSHRVSLSLDNLTISPRRSLFPLQSLFCRPSGHLHSFLALTEKNIKTTFFFYFKIIQTHIN